MDIIQPLELPSVRGKVEIENAQGILYKIHVNGEISRRRKGAWPIPLRNGKMGALRSRGIIPGFQSLYLDGEKVFTMGAHVQLAEKIAMFAPLVLVIFLPFGFLLALALFLLGIPAVKNIQMPRGLRIALPIVNAFAGGLILFLITGHL
jgi:hypothetical protein